MEAQDEEKVSKSRGEKKNKQKRYEWRRVHEKNIFAPDGAF